MANTIAGCEEVAAGALMGYVAFGMVACVVYGYLDTQKESHFASKKA
jgi:hypothetical protein